MVRKDLSEGDQSCQVKNEKEPVMGRSGSKICWTERAADDTCPSFYSWNDQEAGSEVTILSAGLYLLFCVKKK